MLSNDLPDLEAEGVDLVRRGGALAQIAHATPGRTIETLWPWNGLND